MFARPATALIAVMLVVPGSLAQERSRADQISDAVWAAPESLRGGATVLGYGGEPREGDVLTLLRVGAGNLICLADDPGLEGFHTACYHESLEDFMLIGRRLRSEGGQRSAIMDARLAALENGMLEMPTRAVLFSVSADDPPGASEDWGGERRLTVVYLPGASGDGLGLPTRPDGNAPWLMLGGTPWAHIMISR